MATMNRTFWELIREYTINIPIIQRDYAQGRDEEKTKRDKFLTVIYNHFIQKDPSDPPLDLIFVYGRILNKIFFPIDGQQRLTTLFLLHWYISIKERVNENERKELVKFIYDTRISSREFCKAIIENTIVIPAEAIDQNFLADIQNNYWFRKSWEKDPTIKAMLIMIQAIHEKFSKLPAGKLWHLLTNQRIISFEVLDLGAKGFELTDELYIKMNARGKQLTDFENFKADFINWFKEGENSYNGSSDEKTEMPYYLSFTTKIDKEWTNLFWDHYARLKVKSEEKVVDPYFMRFWIRFLLNLYVTRPGFSQEYFEKDELFGRLYGNEERDTEYKYDNFTNYEDLLGKKEVILSIEKILDQLADHYTEIEETIRPAWKQNDEWRLFNEAITQRQRILFYAVTCYLELNPFDLIKFKNWIRIVWNIIIDPKVSGISAMVGSLRFIKQLANHSGDIYKFLRNSDSVLFLSNITYEEQIEEEHFKAILIDKSEEWEPLIIQAESHPLFLGKIRFLLINDGDTDIESFKRLKNSSFNILNDNDLTNRPENYLWIRALLAKSADFILPIELSSGKWRGLINGTLIKGMRLLIDDFSKANQSAALFLNEVCANYQQVDSRIWLYPLIKWKGKDGKTLLGNFSESRMVQFYDNYGNDPNHVYLYNKSIWSPGNILISNNRNEIVAYILKFSNDIHPDNDGIKIQNSYFRGWDIHLTRLVDGINFSYVIDRIFIWVGIRSNSEYEKQFSNSNFDEEEKDTGWICRKKFVYTQVQPDEMHNFILNIENEIFYKSNPDSLLSKIKLFQ